MERAFSVVLDCDCEFGICFDETYESGIRQLQGRHCTSSDLARFGGVERCLVS